MLAVAVADIEVEGDYHFERLKVGTSPVQLRTLAEWLVAQRLEDIPTDVRHEALRSIVNIVGCAVGGSTHPAVDIALRALGPFSGPATAQPLARRERVDPLLASLVNGISSHVYDYDDTTPGNYSHPSSQVASALFAYANANPVSGRDFVHAFILADHQNEHIHLGVLTMARNL